MPDGQIRRLFRQLRTEDHFLNPEGLFTLQQYVRGDWAICHIRGTGVTLYDSSCVDGGIQYHRDLLNCAHRYGVAWENRQHSIRMRLRAGNVAMMEMLL